MIKANDLRLGNWVINQYNEYQQVYKLRDDGRRIHKKNTVSIVCEPIPLTPELLEKCGFKWHCYWKCHLKDNVYFDIFHTLEKEFEIRHKHLSNTDENIVLSRIKYLHQLQNLYYTLTNSELQINL